MSNVFGDKPDGRLVFVKKKYRQIFFYFSFYFSFSKTSIKDDSKSVSTNKIAMTKVKNVRRVRVPEMKVIERIEIMNVEHDLVWHV